MRIVAQQRDSAIGDVCGLRLKFRPAEVLVDGVDVHGPLRCQTQARFGAQDSPHRIIDARRRNPATFHCVH